ncbi:hypothetical protein EBU94_03695 [bacterium]|nr:hypothetical protein [bacterium]
MNLNNYYGFILESVLSSSSDFKKTLKSLDDPIAEKLLDLIGTDIKTKYNYLDVSDEDNKISFIPDDKFQKDIKNPSTALIGRLVRGILKDNDINFTDPQLEDFVNKYKAYAKLKNDLDISVVDGEDIIYWYDEKNHHPSALGNSSSLANSCMRLERCSKYFDIYVENPDSVQLVIFLEEGLLKARALLWKTNSGYYLDRVYSSERSLENMLVEWAEKEYEIVSHFRGSVKELEVELYDSLFLYYPYMDTFKYLDKDNNILRNYPGDTKYIILEDTHGGFTKPNLVWSNNSRRYINESDAVWVNDYSDFYHISDVRLSEYSKCYIPYDFCIWSEPVGSYIDLEKSCEVIVDEYGNTDIFPSDHPDVSYDEDSERYRYKDFQPEWVEFEEKYL